MLNPITSGLHVGRYVIRAKLGAGGMAEVYLADDTQLGRRVALKFIQPDTESEPLAQRRLLREARAAATLDHPHICSIYEVGEADGRQFIAMQFVDGEALDVRLRRSPLDSREILTLAVQIVDGLSEAHAHDILHRDIKPANIMVTARGEAKVMDFGLAKHTAGAAVAGGETVTAVSHLGEIIGTAAYMSPEQARGEALDARSDLFSVGGLLFEMVTGQRPFQATSAAAIAAAILTQDPPPLARFAPQTPAELDRIVTKLLKKDPAQRYQTARDLLIDLQTLKEEQEFQAKLGRTPMPASPSAAGSAVPAHPVAMDRRAPTPDVRPPGRARSLRVGTGVIALLVLAAVAWFGWRAMNVRWATARLAELSALADARRNAEAFDLAVVLERYLPNDPTIARVMSSVSDTISVTTDPAGASVYLKGFPGSAAPSPRQLVGVSPIQAVRIARGQYVLSIVKDGYAPIERTVSGVAVRTGALTIMPPPIRITQRLQPAAAVPERMVLVPGGEYRLISWSRPTDRRVRLDDYFIDKYEVSNEEYKEFVNAGGYLKPELWKHAFVKDGRAISRDEALRGLVDRTGLPGPRSWSNQTFPDGKAAHPVTDITWYEADAYAAFRGKQLATIFQWEKAARNGFVGAAGVATMPWGLFYPGDPLDGRANFGTSPAPTTTAEFGMSVFGVYNMAGNVAEWTRNDSSDGYLATGGAWGDPLYSFGKFGGRPGLFSSDKLGFRCVRSADVTAAGDQSGLRIELDQEVPQYTASSPQQFATLAAAYRYEKGPLDARIEQTITTPEWTREKISFNGANGARALAYLYLPLHAPRPLQVIQYLPAGDVDGGFRSVPDSMDDRMAPFVRAGRAAFCVVLEGYIERLRPANFVRPDLSTVEFAEIIIGRVTDLRRGIDYLETRPDVDKTRLAVYAPSAGSVHGLILGAVETRYRAFVFSGAGLPGSIRVIHATGNPSNFAPHILVPKLIVQGRYDEDTPLRTAVEPLFKLLSEPKKLALYDGGHVPSVEVSMSLTRDWLDEHMGRVGR
jgi:formylglycine-generating enzyme required for sulfatase activity/tRNA A-37 threonylcarbamoyl transferase component Bud32